MKALVYHGPGAKAWEEVPDPVILKPTDAIVRIDTTTICGTDLHILKGDVAAVTDGRILITKASGRSRRSDRPSRRSPSATG
jgi:alcohol dehydrogenase